jgi:hypothetical protein
MVQPWDYFHVPPLDPGEPGFGLVVENYLSRTENGTGNPSSGANTLYAQPWFTGDLPLNVASFGLRVTSIGTAKVDLAVYEATSERNIYPSNRIWQSTLANEIVYGSTGAVLRSVAMSFAAGKLYWFVTNTDGGSGAHTCAFNGQALNFPAGVLGWLTSGSVGATTLTVARSYASGMPATFPAGAAPIGGSGFVNRVAPAIIVVPQP